MRKLDFWKTDKIASEPPTDILAVYASVPGGLVATSIERAPAVAGAGGVDMELRAEQ